MERTLFLAFIVFGAQSCLGTGEKTICSKDYIHHGDSCYMIIDSVTSVSWMEAVKECQKESGKLAEPRSFEVTEFLRELTNLHHKFKGQTRWFIGLTDMFNGNKWVLPSYTSEPPYTLWREGSPSKDRLNNMNCVMMEWEDGLIRWKDVGCVDFKGNVSNPISPICERKRCPSDGYVQYFNNRCYYTMQYGLKWQEAEDFCVSLGGNLASVTSEEEQYFLKNKFGRDAYWLGGRVIEINDTKATSIAGTNAYQKEFSLDNYPYLPDYSGTISLPELEYNVPKTEDSSPETAIAWTDGSTSNVTFWSPDFPRFPINHVERIAFNMRYSGLNSWYSDGQGNHYRPLCKI